MEKFSRKLLDWFERAKRPLPWRADCEPYHVWISEIMLQQTQMERGVEYFKKWIRLFPTVRAVAEADEAALLAAWEGLGYYSRARNLHKAAKEIVTKFGGEFPGDFPDIRALPGVGEYTAGAISSIAFNTPHPAVDANVLRIFSRIRDIPDRIDLPETRATVTEITRELTPEGNAREFCQALMELGALVCGKNPRCGVCPVCEFCLAFHRGTVAERPVKKAPAQSRKLETVAAVILRGGKVLVRRRPPGGLWPGLWEFPGGTVEEGERPEDALIRYVGVAAAGAAEKIATVRHSYTVWRVTLHGYLLRVRADVSGGGEWVEKDVLADYAFPSGQRKLLGILGWKDA